MNQVPSETEFFGIPQSGMLGVEIEIPLSNVTNFGKLQTFLQDGDISHSIENEEVPALEIRSAPLRHKQLSEFRKGLTEMPGIRQKPRHFQVSFDLPAIIDIACKYASNKHHIRHNFHTLFGTFTVAFGSRWRILLPELAALGPNVFFLRSESTANAERIEFCGCENAVQTEDLRLLDELLHCMYEYSRSLCPDIGPAEWSASHNPILSGLWEEFFQVLTSILDSNSARDISGISACMERGLDEPLQEAFDEMRRKLSRLGGNNSLATNQCIGRRATQILTAQTPI